MNDFSNRKYVATHGKEPRGTGQWDKGIRVQRHDLRTALNEEETKMYRDLIGAPEQIEAAGKTWWTQMFCKWSGELEAINLYDEDGDFVAEFSSEEELNEFLKGVR